MRLRELKLRNFRNYQEQSFKPGETLNVLVGMNAQGKSNLLEAVYLLATTRSLRAMRESEMIRQGAETASVWADAARERDADVELDLAVFASDKKSVRINGVKRTRVLELLGQLNAVYFGALDLAIVAGDPSVRRRYLNIEISQISPKYVFDLGNYKKALEQRNRLLRDLRDRPNRNSGIEAWNEQLIQYGTPLFQKRRFFLGRLAPLADEIHRGLTNGQERLTIRYIPSITLPEEDSAIARGFHAELEKAAAEETRRGVTLVGPQRDDIQFIIEACSRDSTGADDSASSGTFEGLDARSFGSLGQQRTVVLSLKLAQFRLMEEYIGETPILLLDDVMSDLDDSRRTHLLRWIDRSCQSFVTCTTLSSFPDFVLSKAAIFKVDAGVIAPQVLDQPGTVEPIAPKPIKTNGHKPSDLAHKRKPAAAAKPAAVSKRK